VEINVPAEIMMEGFNDVDSNVAIIQEATGYDIVNSIIEEKGRNSGNEDEEEDHVNEERQESCSFLEAIYIYIYIYIYCACYDIF
jgi:hypothetical protein